MYRDIKKIRSNDIRLYFNEQEIELIEQLVSKTGGVRAAMLRDLVIQGAIHALNDTDKNNENEDTFSRTG